ncbi:hypothetical protein CTEN210_12211 [Chaetoceros tenuissimus]|uniref:HSF-type DNA-binding domain-containing protein n=1 Tax=Chaetoceros tenuissimus TaxID=426638 RepID=A0AAD3D368_9STRA|nr:hypothetical protein CTEN210_12211 [Chaetoceros tenuissimus]
MNGNASSYNDYTDFPGTYVQRSGAGGGLPFPVKLFVLLKYIDLKEPNLQAIFSWNHHGRSFKIHNLNNFCQIILPRFFPKCSYETFRRQLNFWGFKRRTRGLVHGKPDYGSYYHEKFLRSKDYLCRLIERKKYSNRRAARQSPDSSSGQENKSDQELAGSEEEPDFLILRTMPSSEQCRLVEPESDDDLFALLLQGSSYCNSNGNNNAESSDTALAISSSHRQTTNYFSSSGGSMLEMPRFRAQEQMSMSSSNYTVLLGQYLSSIGDISNNTQSRLDHRHFAYHNIDLQRILSDENEWQWRNLVPFPIGFQPPPTQDEVEDLQNFFKFVREANGQS